MKSELSILFQQCIQHWTSQKRLELLRGNPDDFLFALALLHFLIAAHQEFHIIGPLSRLPPLPFHAGSQRAGKTTCQHHH